MANANLTSNAASAAHRVFAIPELAEHIFLHLTPSELLTKTQRVCKQWLDMITDSAALQEVLFFRPIARSALCYDCIKGVWLDYGGEREMTLVENPFAMLLSHPNPPTSFTLPTASWRRMLLTQPPVRVVCFCSRDDWADLDSVARNAGVQLGDLQRPVYGITGSSKWLPFEDHGQLQGVKLGVKSGFQDTERLASEDEEVAWEEWLAWKRDMCCSAWSGCV